MQLRRLTTATNASQFSSQDDEFIFYFIDDIDFGIVAHWPIASSSAAAQIKLIHITICVVWTQSIN